MKKTMKWVFAAALALTAGFSQAQSSTLILGKVNETMIPNFAYYSPNKLYYAIFQAYDGNLVVYKSSGVPLWSTGGRFGTTAILQQDANLVIYKGEVGVPANAVWSSNTVRPVRDMVPPMLQIDDAGSLKLYDYGAGSVIWQSPRDPNAPITGPGCTTGRQYPICVFPGTTSQFNSWVLACSMADAQYQAAMSGAAFGSCR